MSKTGGAVQKLQDKAARNKIKFRIGTHKAMISREPSTYAEKRIAFIEHQRTVRGVIGRSGEYTQEPRRVLPAETFRGDGLPDEVIVGSKNWAAAKQPKSNAQRAAEDKRAPLREEMRDGWKPQAWRGRRYS